AFGGVLNYIYNRPNVTALWGAGARKYRILHRVGSSGAFTPLRRTWSNYRWTGSTFVLESFGPDASDCYELRDPAFDYSTKDLLFQWNSAGGGGDPAVPTGLHEFQVEFRSAANAVVPAPPQTLSLFVDNNLPEVRINDVQYKGASVGPC